MRVLRTVASSLVLSPLAVALSDFTEGAPKFQPRKLLSTQQSSSGTCVPPEYQKGRRVVSAADWHGDWDHASELMSLIGITDSDGKWAAGDAIFVQTGDVLDRGNEGKRLYEELLFPLKEDAEAEGGQVALLIGDHELFALWGYPKYTTNYDFCFYTDDPDSCLEAAGWPAEEYRTECHHLDVCCKAKDCNEDPSSCPPGNCDFVNAWSLSGDIGRKFREVSQAAFKVLRAGGDDWVYLHAGATPGLVEKFPTVDSLNAHSAEVFKMDNIELYYSDDIILESHAKEDGPFWNRICYIKESDWNKTDAERCADVQTALDGIGASRMVIGHCPAPHEIGTPIDEDVFESGWGKVEAKCSGSFLNADTLMSIAYTINACDFADGTCADMSMAGAEERSQHNEAAIEFFDGDDSGKAWINYPRRNPPECWELAAVDKEAIVI